MNLLDAFQLAADLHRGQVDKAGRPYLEHLVRVMLRVQEAGGDIDQQIAALLHDSVEDGKATSLDLIEAGASERAVFLIDTLTKLPVQDYLPYIGWIKQYPHAVLIKRADLADNSDPERLALLDREVAAKLAEKYRKALELLDS